MRWPLKLAILALPFALAACGGGDDGSSTPATSTTTVAPLPTRFDVQPCLDQVVTTGATVANLVVPDTLKLDTSKPNGFPNGRRLTDPVIDITLAFLFLDLKKQSLNTFVNMPLNPPANDLAFRAEFPYLAAPQGSPPGLTPGGINFNFRTDPPSSYVQVDRMGMPAVATAVIGSSTKTAYNDDSPALDGTRKYVAEIQNTLTALATGLDDDFAALGLQVCAKGA